MSETLTAQIVWLELAVERLRAELGYWPSSIPARPQTPPSPKSRRARLSRYERAQVLAAERGIDWYLSEDEYLGLIIRPCVDCSGPVGGGVGLDRVDENGAYTLSNVEPCCGQCNLARHRAVLARRQ